MFDSTRDKVRRRSAPRRKETTPAVKDRFELIVKVRRYRAKKGGADAVLGNGDVSIHHATSRRQSAPKKKETTPVVKSRN